MHTEWWNIQNHLKKLYANLNDLKFSVSFLVRDTKTIVFSIHINDLKYLFCFVVDQSKPSSDKELKKKPLSSLVLAVAVVGFLMVFSFLTFMLHLFLKKLKKNARARKRGSGKYVKDANISSNGKAVTVGEQKNVSFEEEIHKTGTALY